MKVGVDEKRVAIEAIATLAHFKSNLVNFLLRPSGVPIEVYASISKQRDEVTNRQLTKRQMAPLLLEALEDRYDYSEIVEGILGIAANWDRFELSDKEKDARTVKTWAQEILQRHQQLQVEDEERRDTQKNEQDRQLRLARRRELGLLLEMFDSLAGQNQDAQRRGYLLQDLLDRLFVAFEIPVHASFVRNGGAEQIDGAFQLDSWYYLTECRWRRHPSDTSDLDSLLGKIQRSARQSMGLFVSINGWSENVPEMLKRNPEKAIILMHGYDLRTILSEEIDLRAYISAAVRHLNLKSEPYLSVKEYLAQIS